MMAQLHPRLTHPSRREPGRNGGSLGLQGALGPHQEGSGLSLELPRRELVYLRVGFVPPWATGVGDREALEPSVPGQPYLVDEATWLMKQCMNHMSTLRTSALKQGRGCSGPTGPARNLFRDPVQPPSGVVDMLLSPSSPLAAPRRRRMKPAGSQLPAVAMGQHLWAGRQLYSHVPSTWGGLCRECACDGPGILAISGIQG